MSRASCLKSRRAAPIQIFVRSVLTLCLAAAALAGLTALPGAGASKHAAASVAVTERDFRIAAPRRIAAGEIRFSVTNEGPDTHELIVVRTGKPLPLRSDGLTVDENRVEHRIVGALEPKSPRTRHTLSLYLAPGRYVLFCNMAGHYLGGMHRVLVVR